jgi:hypothetical protein
MATTSRSHPKVGDRLAFREPLERPRPSDPGGDEDVPSERESDEGRESDRRVPDEHPRDLVDTA